jgi:hypothetical protein
MKKAYAERLAAMRALVAPVFDGEPICYLSGLVLPPGAENFEEAAIAVLDEDQFSDAIAHVLEVGLPAAIRSLLAKHTVGTPYAGMSCALEHLLMSVDHGAAMDDLDDDVIQSLLCAEEGGIVDKLDSDGFMVVVRPSIPLIAALLEMDPVSGKKTPKKKVA